MLLPRNLSPTVNNDDHHMDVDPLSMIIHSNPDTVVVPIPLIAMIQIAKLIDSSENSSSHPLNFSPPYTPTLNLI